MERSVIRTEMNDDELGRLLGIYSSKIGFYAEVKQKINELEAANAGLRNKSSELQAVFDSIADGVVIYDHNGLVQHRNHVCPRLFPRETMAGAHCSQLFHPETVTMPLQCPVERALAGERVETTFTITCAKSGKISYFDITSTQIEDAHADNKRALVFIRDVTEKRMQELQLMQAEKLSSIGVLAAGVAHEINNPLNSVSGYAEALLRRFREEESLSTDARLVDFQKYLNVIIRESYRCKGIIDSLLSFSRKSDGSIGPVNINDVMREILELVRYKSRYEKVEIRTELHSGLPLIIGDESSLRQVFMNLLLNAHQSIEGSGLVEINTGTVEGTAVFIRIRDTGCGISKESIDQIWDPFFTTKNVGQGLGLGLAITYNIIKRHGGEINVESTIGVGTTFTVRIPVCQK